MELMRGFPLRHLRYARGLLRDTRQPKEWTNASFPHSQVAPTATYSPWLTDDRFRDVYDHVKEHTLVDVYRCYELWNLVRGTARLPGAILEVGVWRGGTGAILAAANSRKTVYLADTFRGVVKAGDKDTRYVGGEHADTSRDTVEHLFLGRALGNYQILQGIFPEETAWLVTDEAISLLHCDVDVYESTRDVVEWALPRLSPGGVMVFDDYGFHGCEGVTRYVNELRSRENMLFIHNLNGHGILVKESA